MGTVTWLQLGSLLAAIAGIAGVMLGLLAVFASGMAARPDGGLSRQGCNFALFGMVLISLSIWGFTR